MIADSKKQGLAPAFQLIGVCTLYLILYLITAQSGNGTQTGLLFFLITSTPV
jgi:hypothetical protein